MQLEKKYEKQLSEVYVSEVIMNDSELPGEDVRDRRCGIWPARIKDYKRREVENRRWNPVRHSQPLATSRLTLAMLAR